MSRSNSQLARSLASAQGWGTINSCRRIAPGVWQADCAGHGGLLAPLSAVPDELTRDALRSLGAVWTVWQVPGKRPYWDSPGSTWYGDQVRDWPGATSTEWVLGEEDCGWALVAAAIPGIVATMSNPANAATDAARLIDTYWDDAPTVTDGVCRWSARSVLLDRLTELVA